MWKLFQNKPGILLLFAFGLIPLVMPAQGTTDIRGKVIDSETGAPLPFSTIYFNNTSIGAIADSSGIYTLNNVPVHFTDLVFSSVGYESFLSHLTLTSGKKLTVVAKLRPLKQLLTEVVVKSTRDKDWNKNYALFIEAFLGTGPNTSSCEIKNAGNLNFTRSWDGRFTASSTVPLEIINHALGYTLTLELNFFEKSDTSYRSLFHCHFEELSPKDDLEKFRWRVGRLHSYKGSQRHLLRSLVLHRSQEEGFLLYHSSGSNLKNRNEYARQTLVPVPLDQLRSEEITLGSLQGYYKLLKAGTYEVHYLNETIPGSDSWYPAFPHPVSWIQVTGDFLYCPPTGIIRSNSNSTVFGHMNSYRVSDLLPEDYNPVQEETAVYLTRYHDPASVEGTVTDSITHQPLAGAHVFINNSLYKTRTDEKGHFTLRGVPQGDYELVTAYGNYPPFNQVIGFHGDSIAFLSIRMALPPPDPWPQDSEVKPKKLNLIETYLLGWSPSVDILNPDVLEIKRLTKQTQLRTRTPLEIEDHRTGYKITYFLKEGVLYDDAKIKPALLGFSEFDTLQSKSLKQHEKWVSNRYAFYKGSINHFLYALTEGRTREEGFELHSFAPSQAELTNRMPSGKKKETGLLMAGDSVLTMAPGKPLFELKFPSITTIQYLDGKPTKIENDHHLFLSRQGILSSRRLLFLDGPLEQKEIPHLPVEYLPLNEKVSDPKVWVYIQQNEINALQQLREKAFVQTDKGYYYPGEKIWYKAYMQYNSLEFKNELSTVLHVELIHSTGRIIRDEMLKITDGVAWGDVALPDTLKPGNYFLRAYTRWSLNFGNDYIFTQVLPVLPTNQNVSDNGELPSPNAGGLSVSLQPDHLVYKPRSRVMLKLMVTNSSGKPVRAHASVSVTDAGKVASTSWSKVMTADTLQANQSDWKYQRVTFPIERELGYACRVDKTAFGNPVSVLITSLRDKRIAIGRPDAENQFDFTADFNDTATFIFRASLANGHFGGHVVIEKPQSPKVVLPLFDFPSLLRPDDAAQRIKYAYDPTEKSTLLDEVIVRGQKVEEAPLQISRSSSITQSPNYVIQGDGLSRMTQSAQDMSSFFRLLINRIPGARFNEEEQVLTLRRSAAMYRINNVPVPLEALTALSPVEIDRIEIYTLLGLISIYLKTGQAGIPSNQYDRFILSGYATPSIFFMRDYSKSLADHAFPDLRTTVYWAPEVVTGEGESILTFYCADIPTKYRIVVQGLSEEGRPLYGEQFIAVQE